MYFLLVAILLEFTISFSNNLLVKTKLGYVRGFSAESRNGRTYSAFLGFQYGVPSKRFQPADPVTSWSGVKNALKYGSQCPQTNVQKEVKSVDANCLNLNVYVPEINANMKLSVLSLSYIHGGAWYRGSSANFGEKYFMDEDLVLVTINYRIGALGFLGVINPKAPGNIGFSDQILALKWVRDNIAHFGGDDEDRVTIMGESAGAGSVAHFLTSPHTKGLFHRAIHQSGAILEPWAWRTIDDAESVSIRFGQKLGCDTTNLDLLVDCLIDKDVSDILKAQADFVTFYVYPNVPFMPVVGPSDPLALLPENPADVLREGKFNQVPTIFT